MKTGMDVDGADGNRASSTDLPDSVSGPNPAVLSVLLPPPRGPSERLSDSESSSDTKCEPSQVRVLDWAQSDEMTWDQFSDLCFNRGFRRKESKAVLKTRLTAVDAAEGKRNSRGSAL